MDATHYISIYTLKSPEIYLRKFGDILYIIKKGCDDIFT